MGGPALKARPLYESQFVTRHATQMVQDRCGLFQIVRYEHCEPHSEIQHDAEK